MAPTIPAMPRRPRLVVPDLPHHVTHCGNHGQQIFFSDADRRLYLRLLVESAALAQVRLWGWCLMSNHIHWIVVPSAATSLAGLVQRAHGEYARYRHRLRSTVGHLWQARFFSCPLYEAHQWQALAYVERNPVRAGLVQQPEQYCWSSARDHLGITTGLATLDLAPWQERYKASEWSMALASSLAEEALARRIREATRTGLPSRLAPLDTDAAPQPEGNPKTATD